MHEHHYNIISDVSLSIYFFINSFIYYSADIMPVAKGQGMWSYRRS